MSNHNSRPAGVNPRPEGAIAHTDRRKEIRAAVEAARSAGISVVPPREDGTKAPLAEWKRFQKTPPTNDELRAWYGPRTGLGFVCGAVSGGLELLELDADFYAEFKATAEAVGLGTLLGRIEAGYLERSPGGGWHLFYRCSEVRGNTKLARRPGPPDAKGRPTIEVLIETRGEGGFAVVAPSNGLVHPSGGRYELVSGGPATIAEISGAERDALWDLAKSFDRMPSQPAPSPEPTKRPAKGEAEGVRPGDDFNAREPWEKILPAHGWTALYTRGETTYWRRPGKSEGWSATTNHNGSGLLWVFTSSSVFEAERSYDKFGAYAVLNHGGDFTLATRSLGQQGYGDPAKPRGKAQAKARPAPPAPPVEVETAAPIEDRPAIEITPERHLVADQAVAALASDPELFSRGESLVMVVDEPSAEAVLPGNVAIRNAKGSPRVVALTEAVVGFRLTRCATFYEWRPTRKGEPIAADCHPPSWLTRGVTELKHWPGIRPLMGVTECPYIRADGTVNRTPGYDRQTGTLYRPTMDFPELPAKPSQAHAKAAAARILGHVAQFPFATDNDRAVWLAGLLAAAAMPRIARPTPGIAFNGNRAGCGKGLLVDVIGLIVTGHNVPTSAYPGDPAEAQKVKVAIGLSGKSIVHFDNLEEGRSYGNSALDSALTSGEVDDRILGTSKTTGRLPLRVSWFLSGNNVAPAKDAYRRWLPCNLSTELERPEEREDIAIPDLRAHILENRGAIVRDVLTILKAHADAGYPKGQWPPLGSFEAWDGIIRAAVWFATGWDCCATRREAAEEAPERLDKLALLEAWRDMAEGGPTGRGVTADEAVEIATRSPDGALYQALMRHAKEGKPNARRIGVYIRGIKGAVIEGLKFEKAGDHRRSALWRVVGRGASKPDRQCEYGEYGEYVSNSPSAGADEDNDIITCGGVRIPEENDSAGYSPDSPYSHPLDEFTGWNPTTDPL